MARLDKTIKDDQKQLKDKGIKNGFRNKGVDWKEANQ